MREAPFFRLFRDGHTGRKARSKPRVSCPRGRLERQERTVSSPFSFSCYLFNTRAFL